AVPLDAGNIPDSVTAGAFVYPFSGGDIASALFAAVPFIVPAGGSTALAIGLIAQSGGLATLVGPPLAGAVIEHGWAQFGWMLVAVALAGLAACVPLMKRRHVQDRWALPLGRLACRRLGQRLLFQRQYALGQPVELLFELFDRLTLLGDLAGKLLDL